MTELIEATEKTIKTLEWKKRSIKSNKQGTKNEKKGKLKPIEEELKFLYHKMNEMLYIKDKKIPFYEKLPKESQFYIHFMN